MDKHVLRTKFDELASDVSLLQIGREARLRTIENNMRTYINAGGGYPYMRLARLIEAPYATVLRASTHFVGRPLQDHEILYSAEALRYLAGWKCELIGAVSSFESQRRRGHEEMEA